MGLENSQHTGRLVIHPTNPDIVYASVLGSIWHNDPKKNAERGLFKTSDGGATWKKVLNAGEHAGVAEVALDPSRPDTICAGAWHRERFGEWSFSSTGAESADPSVVYTESQYGALVRFNPFTGERRGIRPQAPQGTVYRWNWNAPIRISPHDPNTLYFGSQFLHRSRDKGATWETISPDLTRAIKVERNAISDYGTLLWIQESPRRQGLIATGSDDGLIHITVDGGKEWNKATPLPGVPEKAQIRRVLLSAHADNTIYAAASAHEADDFRPYVLRSTDLDKTWTSIVSNLPVNAPVFALAEDPARQGHVNARVTAPVTLEIFDASGARVRAIDLGPRDEIRGLRRAVWDMRAEPAAAAVRSYRRESTKRD